MAEPDERDIRSKRRQEAKDSAPKRPKKTKAKGPPPTIAPTSTGPGTSDRVRGGRVERPRSPGGTVSKPHKQIDKRRAEHPEQYPDLDFHQLFGSHLSKRNPLAKDVDEDVAAYWKILSTNPALLQHQIPEIIELYHSAFKNFFGLEAISLHGHVSDATNPYLLISLLMHLEANQKKLPKTSKKSKKPKRVELVKPIHKENARFAVTNLYYGSGFGPQAHNSVVEEFQGVACGPKPEIVNTQDPDSINKQVRDAKNAGCSVLFTEIVRAGDGSVMSVESWKALVKSCKQHYLALVVDEAMTAIRCGAPFAYQLPEYAASGYPDLVLFGKAIRTCGIAVEPRGGNIRRLQIPETDFPNIGLNWTERLTELAPIPDLLISTGTILLALKENWPQRAQDIGRLLREIIESEDWCEESTLGGLHSLIYLRKEHYKQTTSPVMGASAKTYVRWLPTMDKVMQSREELTTKVFGAESLPHREETSAWFDRRGLRSRWCWMCGSNAQGRDDLGTCHECVAPSCKDCEPDEHRCPMENLDSSE